MIREAILFERLQGILKCGWIPIPKNSGFGGSGAPGMYLEHLLGCDAANQDVPDSGKWEIKFHSGSALMTLFHLEGEPSGHMHHLVRAFGWKDTKGRLSFRHTIRAKSAKGFYVVNESNRITVRNDTVSDMQWPYWTHDRLLNAFASKLRRLMTVQGKCRKNRTEVRYNSAHFYSEPQITLFVDAVAHGIIAIDFDARTNNGRGLRNHGTKFRVSYDDLRLIYREDTPFNVQLGRPEKAHNSPQ